MENKRAHVYHDFFINVIETEGGLDIDWDHASDVYTADTVNQWIESFEGLLNTIDSAAGKKLGDLGARERSTPLAAPVAEPRDLQLPNTPAEHFLAHLVGDVLGREISDVGGTFFDVGGHSIAAMRLVSRLRREGHARVQLADVFNADSLAALALLLQLPEQDKAANDPDDTWEVFEV